MAINFEDRVASYPNRYKVTPITGEESYYVVLERADEPTVVGTPINADTFRALHADLSPTYGTTDLVAGSSALETGKLYFVYE